MKTIDYKVQGGKMLKIKLVLDEQVINSVTILGDFFLHPESTIEVIEDRLRGCRVDRDLIINRIQDVLNKHNAVIIGATASDIAKAIEKASLST